MSEPFEDNEKRSMLAEMIRASRIDVGAVVEFVQRYNIQPNWMDMRYPNGRTPNECRQLFESMGIAAPPPAQLQPAASQQYKQQFCQPPQHGQQQQQQQQNLQRQQQHQPHVLQNIQPATPLPPMKRKPSFEATEPLPKRLAITTAEVPTPRPRAVNIQPRPSPTGLAAAPLPTVDTVASPPPNPSRKRGRPSKADREAKSRASLSIGAAPPLLAPAPKPDRFPTSTTSPLAEYSPLPSATSVRISARASSEPKVNTRTGPITPRQAKGASHEPEDEQNDGSIHHDSGLRHSMEDNRTPLRLELPRLLPKSSPAQELPASHGVRALESQHPSSRVSVATLLKTGIEAV